MKRWIFLFLLFLMGTIGAYAQGYSESQLDSIYISANQKMQQEEYGQALSGFLVCMQESLVLKSISGRNRYEYSALYAALCYEYQEKYELASGLYEEILKTSSSTEVRQIISRQLPTTNYLWALCLIFGRDYEKARVLLQRGLDFATGEIREKSLQKIGLSWYFEGCVLKLRNNNEGAYACFVNAQQYFQKISDKKSEMSVLEQMAAVHKRIFNADSAMQKYSDAAVIAQQVQDTAVWINAWKGRCGLLKELGQWEEYVQLSLSLDSLMTGVRDVNVLLESNYEKGDNALYLWGNASMAESFYIKNLDLIPRLEESLRNSQLFMTCLRLCDVKMAQKKYDGALNYNTQCLSCFAYDFNDSISGDRYAPYQNRAYIYKEMGLRDSAFSCMDSLFQSHSYKSISMNTVAGHYTQRALLHLHFKEYNEAIADYECADSLLAIRYSEDNKDRMRILLATGHFWYNRKDYKQAKKLYVHYGELCRLKYGDHSLEYTKALYYLANIKGFNNEKQNGCDDYRRATSLLKELIKQQLRYLPSNARIKYWNDISDMLWSMTAYAIKIEAPQEAFTQDAYNALLFSKGLLLESEISMRTLLQENGTLDDLAEYNKMTLLQSRLAELEDNAADYAESLKELYSQIDRIDKQLVRKCSSYGNYTRFLDIKYEDIRTVLKEGEVAIDFTDFRSDSVHYYAAYIFRKEWEHPLLISAFKETQLDSLFNAVGHRADRIYRHIYSDSLLEICWSPLSHYIRPGETVYYVPSGILHQLSLESLPIGIDSVLGDKYHFVRLSSTREIHKSQPQCVTHTKAVMYGGLYYDVDLAVMDAESKKFDVSGLFALRGNPVIGDSVFHYLPMTREEVNCIADILGRCRIDTIVYTGNSGSEESFIHLDGQAPQIIHLATHGFCNTPSNARGMERLAGYQEAMLSSGLVMSGGNAGWKGLALPEGVLNGVMTADNISRLNLKGTDLVVLSACKTGRGLVNSEGIYGLQRAFKKAGVQTLIMSLWEISDWVTKEFMIHFYKNLTENGWNKRKAFEDAKFFIRKSYPEPFYWAGFIMLD